MFKQIDNLDEAGELWRAGVLYFKYVKGPEVFGWELDDSGPDYAQDAHFIPSKYYPEDYIYAILLED